MSGLWVWAPHLILHIRMQMFTMVSFNPDSSITFLSNGGCVAVDGGLETLLWRFVVLALLTAVCHGKFSRCLPPRYWAYPSRSILF